MMRLLIYTVCFFVILSACSAPLPTETPQTVLTPILDMPPVQGPAVLGDHVVIEGWEYLGPESVESFPNPSATVRKEDILPYEIRLVRTEDGFELVWGALLCRTQPVVVVRAKATIEFWPGESVNPDCEAMQVGHRLMVQWQTDIPFEKWIFIFHPPPGPES